MIRKLLGAFRRRPASPVCSPCRVPTRPLAPDDFDPKMWERYKAAGAHTTLLRRGRVCPACDAKLVF